MAPSIPHARAQAVQGMRELTLSNHENEVANLQAQIYQEQEEKEELIEILENLHNENKS